MKLAEDYSDDKFVNREKRRQRTRHYSCISLVVLAIAALVAMLVFWK